MPVKWNLTPQFNAMKDRVEKGVKEIAEYVELDASLRILNPPKTGRVYSGPPYRIGKPPHQASAPGESPAEDTGTLRESGKVTKRGRLKYEVKFRASYAADLEFGNLNKNIEPRPFLRPAILEGRKNIKRIMELEINRK